MPSVHHSKTKSPDGAPKGVSLKLLKAVAGGTTSTTLLAQEFNVAKARISYLAAGLINEGWLRKDGKNYALTPKAKKSTTQAESSIASQAASG